MGGINAPPVDAAATTPAENCELRFEPGLFHQRDGDHPGRNRVGNRRAGYRAHQARTDHGHDTCPTGKTACQAAGKIDDKVARARLEQKRTKQDEHEHIGRGDIGGHAEHAFFTEVAAVQDRFQAQAREGKHATDVAAHEQNIAQ